MKRKPKNFILIEIFVCHMFVLAGRLMSMRRPMKTKKMKTEPSNLPGAWVFCALGAVFQSGVHCRLRFRSSYP